MFDYITAKDAAEKWGISERRVQKLCEENRIPDVVRLGHSWIIPREAEKPEDMRKKKQKAGGECAQTDSVFPGSRPMQELQ